MVHGARNTNNTYQTQQSVIRDARNTNNTYQIQCCH